MMRSMYSGVSGLRVHQTKMDVIGNNIANVNTNGYKSQRVTFNDVFSQTLQSGTGASEDTGRGGRNPMQVGLGVNVSSIDMLMTAGAAQRTDNPFDLMVEGDGFLVVGDNTGTYFTRAGALRLDSDGNLVIPNGMKVKGWPATETGKDIAQGEVVDLNLHKFQTASPEGTKDIQLVGNINTNDSPYTAQIKFYDTLGNFYTTNIEMKLNATTPGKWDVTPKGVDPKTGKFDSTTDANNTHVLLTDQKGNKFTVPKDKFTAGEVTFDKDGKILEEGTPPNKKMTPLKVATFSMQDVQQWDYSKTPPEEIKGKKPNATINDLTVDFSNMTQYSAKTNVDTKLGNEKGEGAGTAPGTLMGYSVGGDGRITASYDNGTTRLLGQIVVANFVNPAGLEKAGSNLFRTTNNSGDFDNIGKAGTFQSGVLEMSNVDLSQEFTEMITTQRGFQANSRIISTSDEMLQELVNIKR